jgi:hypothetical protein
MKTSELINELAGALAKAQAEVEGAHKSSDNPFFKSRYADLASVWDACREPLTKNNLAVVQHPSTEILDYKAKDDKGNEFDSSYALVHLTTRLIHSSGQWIEGEVVAEAKDAGPQSIGSAITYLRRYALQSIVGVAPEDDDGNAATNRQPVQRQQVKPKTETNGKHDDPPLGPVKPLRSKEWDVFAKWLETQVPVPFRTRAEAMSEVLLAAGSKWNAESIKQCDDLSVLNGIKQAITDAVTADVSR